MYPYDESEAESGMHEPQHKLQRLVEDPLYWREQDSEFRSYVDNGFKAVYGNDAAEADATGRTIDPVPKPVALPPFKPSVTADDMKLDGGVGDNQPNRWRDVWTVQKGLSNTGHYTLDLAKEKSGERSSTLDNAIRNCQRDKREQIDGTLLPGGPTIKRLGESLHDRGLGPKRQSSPRIADGEGEDRGSFLHLASGKIKPRPPGPPQPSGPKPNPTFLERLVEEAKRFRDTIHPKSEASAAPENRAVIFAMPNGDDYILLNPIPRGERRPHEASDFVRRSPAPDDEPHKAKHFDYKKDHDARRGFRWALPMYPEEAAEVRRRAADHQDVSPHNPRMANKPMYPANPRREDGDRRRKVYIRFYHRDGSKPSRELARNPNTGKPLYAPGNEDVVISAPDAVRLGLIDWMDTKPSRGNFPEIFERDSWNRFGPVPPGEQDLWK